jgi:hypothetical protein
MVLLGDIGQVESHFGRFGDRVSVGYYVTRLKWKLILDCLEIVLISTQDSFFSLCRSYHRHGNHFRRTR